MGIGSITSTNSMSNMQMITAASTDPKIKNIKNEITDAEQQMHKISSKEELSVNEKTDEQKKLKKEISSLNTKLKQQQEELLRAQKRESMLAELREDKKPAKEEKSEDKVQIQEFSSDKADEKNLPADQQQTNSEGSSVITRNNDGTVVLKAENNQDDTRSVDTAKEQDDEAKEKSISEEETKATASDKAEDTGLSHKEVRAMVSADSSVQQANNQGSVIARTRDGIAILKGEMNQDEKRGIDTERKQNELEKMEKREQRATSFQSSILGEANNTMKSATETIAAGTNDSTQVYADGNGNAYINALNLSQEDDQTAQQRFYVSFS